MGGSDRNVSQSAQIAKGDFAGGVDLSRRTRWSVAAGSSVGVVVDLVNNTPYLYRPQYLLPRLSQTLCRRHSFVHLGQPESGAISKSGATRGYSTALDGWLPVVRGYGGHGQVVFEYDTPWPAQNKGEDQISWQKQPGTVNDKVNVTWNDGNGHVYTVSGDLGQDRVIAPTPTGVTLTSGQPAQAQLPSLSLG